MILSSASDMEAYGAALAQRQTHLLLYGDLAAGKTTFVRGFVQGLGLSTESVSSPTYAYMHIYEHRVVHIDMYRLEDESELVGRGFLEAIVDYEHVLIEWPKWTEHYVDKDWIGLQFDKINETEREVREISLPAVLS